MKVLHVISGISRKGGGPSRSSQGLVKALCEAGVDAWIHSFDREEPWVDGVRAFRRLEGLDAASLKEFDLVHIHGIWDRRLHAVAKLCRKAKVPYVIAPRGMLEPWSLQQKWLKKRIARFLYQDRDLKKAAALHATAESEKEQFRKLGFKNYCIVSPNGVNLPLSQPQPSPSTSYEKRALFVSRMHPKKGVMELVEAWARVKPEGWICELVYTKSGAEELAYEQKVMARVKELGLEDQFVFTGPLDDDAKWEAYARADLFVLPTYSENFGIVIAEALWAGVPVITTKGTPWGELVGDSSGRCGWWIDLPEGDGLAKWDALDEALKEAVTLRRQPQPLTSTSLSSMGASGHSLIERKYTWKVAIGAMKHGYEQALNTCELAPCDDCRNYGDTCLIR